MDNEILINITYLTSAVLFIFGLKMLGSPATARKGNFISSLGMLSAVLVTLLDSKVLSFSWILTGLGIGIIVGIFAARLVAMTAMPEMVALFNGFGGIASLLVGWGAYHTGSSQSTLALITIFLSVFIGGVTFTGSFVAWGKLSGKLGGKPILYKGQNAVTSLLCLIILGGSVLWISGNGNSYLLFVALLLLSFAFGILAVIPIGGADMPVVISLLNSYSGIAACAAGFVIVNNLLVVAGALVGASGIILTKIMCKAMNRSLSNVLFSGFGSGAIALSSKQVKGEVKPILPEDAYLILEASQSVVIVPGYGLAVAQAQHVVRELGELMEKNGAEVQYAIHPVAGRMPGHMNVLLAEANVPYDQLLEMDQINPTIKTVDVCIVIGANDVVNPAARDEKESPIYGMPIINVDYARTVFVIKRSMAPGFAGIENPLFFKENTRMIFGDAKSVTQALVTEFKE